MSKKTLKINGATLALAYLVVGAVLAGLTLIFELLNYYHPKPILAQIAELVNITRESNPAVFFHLLGYLGCAALLWPVKSAPGGKSWKPIQTGFLLLGLDEIGGIHERLGWTINHFYSPPPLLQKSWIVLAPLVLIPALFLLRRAAATLSESTRRYWILGSLLFVSGTVLLKPLAGWLSVYGSSPLYYFFTAVTEDSLKIASLGFLLYAASETGRELVGSTPLEFR